MCFIAKSGVSVFRREAEGREGMCGIVIGIILPQEQNLYARKINHSSPLYSCPWVEKVCFLHVVLCTLLHGLSPCYPLFFSSVSMYSWCYELVKGIRPSGLVVSRPCYQLLIRINKVTCEFTSDCLGSAHGHHLGWLYALSI